MSKKFLTLFALVAILVAAMAGSAFAAPFGDVNVVRDDAQGNNMGAVDPIDGDGLKNGWSATVYYLDGTDDAKLSFALSADANGDFDTAGAVSVDIVISSDTLIPISQDILLSTIAGDYVSEDVLLSTDVSPLNVHIGIVSCDGAGEVEEMLVTSFDVTFEPVELLSKTELPVNGEFTQEAVKVLGLEKSYDLGDPNLMSGDTVVNNATVVYTDPETAAEIVVSFDKVAGEIIVVQSGDKAVSDEVTITLTLSADQFLVSMDEDAAVAGFEGVAATLVITAGATPEPDPTGDLKFSTLGEEITLFPVVFTIDDAFEEGDYVVSVDKKNPDDARVVTGISVDKTKLGSLEAKAVEGELAFNIVGTADEIGQWPITIELLVGTEEPIKGVFLVEVEAKQVTDGPVVTPVTPGAEDLAKLEADGVTLFDPADVPDTAITEQSYLIGLSLLSGDLSKVWPSAMIDLDVTASGPNAVAVEFHGASDSTLATIAGKATKAEQAALLDVSMDVYYEFLDEDGNTKETKAVIGNRTGAISWKEALSEDVVTFDSEGMKIQYVVVNRAERTFKRVGSWLVINDGIDDTKILDPLWLGTRKASEPGDDGGSSVGCDAGLGVFALLGLAGMAVIFRKKD